MAWAGAQFAGHECSLGYELADWIETYCCHGPGDIEGTPVVLDEEWLNFLVQAYRIHPVTGVRIYDEGVLSRPKGRAKSELAGFIGIAEAFAPCRFDGWNAAGQPIAKPMVSPLIRCLATEESQAGNTFEYLAFIAGQWGPQAHPEIFAGITGMRTYQTAKAIQLPHGGEIVACTAGAASKDGGRESFVIADETHLYVLRELKEMFATVSRNCGKRKEAQPWLLQTTTAYRPGERSVAEDTLTDWRSGQLGDEVYVDHREARGRIDIQDKPHTISQLRYVYGPAAEWIDLEKQYRIMTDPRKCEDEATAARYYLNRAIAGKNAWIADDVVLRQVQQSEVLPGTSIALGFDGSINDDATVLIGARMDDGFIFPIGIWAKPSGPEGNWWEVPRHEVLAKVREAFGRYDVTRMYADPHEWRTDIDQLAEELGDEKVIPWETRRDVQMAAALDRLRVDLMAGTVFHSGDPTVITHFGNAYVKAKGGHRLVKKEYPNSDRKIDSVVGAALAGEARADAIADGWGKPKEPYARATGRVRNY